MPVSSRGPGGVGPGDATRISSPPSTRTPAKTGRVIRCGLQTRLDVGPHGVPCGCQLSGQASDCGSFEAQLSDHPADHPHTQTRPGGAHPLVMFQEYHHLTGAFAAHSAPYCATGTLPGPRPRARRSPPPPHARGLEQVTAHPGHPASWLHDSTSSIRVSGVRVTLIRWKPSKLTSRSHRSHRSSDTEQQQVGPDTTRGPLKIAGVEVRSSPGTSTSTRNPRSTPTHPHSTRKSQFDRGPGSARGRLRHVRARGAAPEDERIKRDGQGPARPGRPAPRTHAPRPRGGGGARRGACAPRSRHPCVT